MAVCDETGGERRGEGCKGDFVSICERCASLIKEVLLLEKTSHIAWLSDQAEMAWELLKDEKDVASAAALILSRPAAFAGLSALLLLSQSHRAHLGWCEVLARVRDLPPPIAESEAPCVSYGTLFVALLPCLLYKFLSFHLSCDTLERPKNPGNAPETLSSPWGELLLSAVRLSDSRAGESLTLPNLQRFRTIYHNAANARAIDSQASSARPQEQDQGASDWATLCSGVLRPHCFAGEILRLTTRTTVILMKRIIHLYTGALFDVPDISLRQYCAVLHLGFGRRFVGLRGLQPELTGQLLWLFVANAAEIKDEHIEIANGALAAQRELSERQVVLTEDLLIAMARPLTHCLSRHGVRLLTPEALLSLHGRAQQSAFPQALHYTTAILTMLEEDHI